VRSMNGSSTIVVRPSEQMRNTSPSRARAVCVSTSTRARARPRG
jgi:hypothetical protein